MRDFFASPCGVCVYVTVGRRAIRVEFGSEDDAGKTPGGTDRAAMDARAAAALVMRQNRSALRPLFEKVAREIAARHGVA
jgi:hypothetical protein